MPYRGYKERRCKFSPSQTIINKSVTYARNIVELKERHWRDLFVHRKSNNWQAVVKVDIQDVSRFRRPDAANCTIISLVLQKFTQWGF